MIPLFQEDEEVAYFYGGLYGVGTIFKELPPVRNAVGDVVDFSYLVKLYDNNTTAVIRQSQLTKTDDMWSGKMQPIVDDLGDL